MSEADPSPLDEAARLLGPAVRRNHPIGALTTYRVGGSAALYLTADSTEDLARARAAVSATEVPVVVIGKGSNTLVADRGFPGLVIALGERFAAVTIDGSRVTAGGSTSLPVLARRSAAAGLTGLEWAVGVPGSVGGALRMNAGGHGSDIAAVLSGWSFVDLRGGPDGARKPEDLDLGYRRSALAAHHVVVSAEFALREGDRARSEREIAEIVKWRRENQPGGQNCGSVFTNPEGDSAGRLVEAAGLKGYRLRSAHVSDKHANFIQADDGGSADDVLALIRHVQRRVNDTFGVLLKPEVRLVGFTDGERE